MEKKINVVIGQSGGPTSVINASLAGAFVAASAGQGTVYGMVHGIEGFLAGNVVDLGQRITSPRDVELLKRTPASYLGSCRHKLPPVEGNEHVYQAIFARIEELGIGYFFYIGGNDSMDTTAKLARYGASIGSDVRFIGIPKTIDNDLAVTDHSPGFGSAAKYIATSIKEVIRDSVAYDNTQVTIIEIMGRNAGWLTAAAALARTAECPGPDIIWLPETPFDLEQFLAKVKEVMAVKKSVVVAVSEGIKTREGKYVCESLGGGRSEKTDAFGHSALGGTASVLAAMCSLHLGCKIRPIELSTLQRCGAHLASARDVEEAYAAGSKAVELAFMGVSGKVIVFKRVSDKPYTIEYDCVDATQIANHERKVPSEWIIDDGTGISDQFIAYARPLIEGELSPILVDGLPAHLVLK